MHRMLGFLLALAGLALTACQSNAGAEPPQDETGFERVAIALLDPGKPDPGDTAVAGYLFRPEGEGPFPAVVMMHGCNGLDWSAPGQPGWNLAKATAGRYRARGYVTLVLDSFAPRGVGNACGRPLLVSPERRAWDAYSAAAYLATRRDIDKARIVLQGDSHGGWTTLVALEAGKWHAPVRFAAGIAWYPYCFPVTGFSAPVLVLIGGADDWTPSGRCIALEDQLRHAGLGREIMVKVFPGATHAYDFPLPSRTNRLGHHMAYDAAATDASWQAVDSFLRQEMP